MSYVLLLIFGLLPSIVWLLFYLRKDVHPESNRMIIKIFFFGMLSAVPAAFVGWGFYKITGWDFSKPLMAFFNAFIVIGFTEEIFKYLVVRFWVLSDPEFDEPLDSMLYMIIAALGFAASENILLFLSPKVFLLPLGETLSLVAFRWISATFLHALASGILGYFLAISFFKIKERKKLLFYGIFYATVLHGLYDFSIIKIEERGGVIIPIVLLVTSALLVSWGFKRLKKMKSVCKVEDVRYKVKGKR